MGILFFFLFMLYEMFKENLEGFVFEIFCKFCVLFDLLFFFILQEEFDFLLIRFFVIIDLVMFLDICLEFFFVRQFFLLILFFLGVENMFDVYVGFLEF